MLLTRCCVHHFCQLLRKERFEWDLACTTVNAISHVKRLAENARDAGGAAAAKSRHGDKLTYHSVILVSGDMEPGDVKPVRPLLFAVLPCKRVLIVVGFWCHSWFK